ncbi:MAG: queuosine precursor transporter [Cytophagales bacterium]|nr:queuosine precursor transporter [Bernardetiaceae bacterium]MDW8209723.1 queuosine precursor transporter [Cytophagales bacterium]
MTSLQQKKSNLFFFLTGLFLTNALVAEMIGTKIFSLEKTFNFPPAQIPLLGDFVLDFNLTAGVLLWPIVFITSDIINEYFGKAGVRKISLLTAFFISYAFVMIYLATQLVPADFWLHINNTDSAGNPLNINEAFSRIFLQSLGIIIGSLTAFLIGQLLDAFTFQWIRRLTGSRIIWLRATGSTLISQLIDSFVVLVIAFYVFANPRWSWEQVISVGIINYIYKFAVALLTIPLLYVMHFAIKSYLGEKASEQMAEEAAQTKFF